MAIMAIAIAVTVISRNVARPRCTALSHSVGSCPRTAVPGQVVGWSETGQKHGQKKDGDGVTAMRNVHRPLFVHRFFVEHHLMHC